MAVTCKTDDERTKHHFAPYLWHLEAAGVIRRERREASYKTKLWNDLLTGNGAVAPKIALIDNGASALHPNLRGTMPCSIDLATHPFGATYVTGESCGADNAAHHFASLDIGALGLADVPGLGPIAASLVAGKGIVRQISAYADEFCMHGTACAGLIVGRPGSDHANCEAEERRFPNALPYFGVDPGAGLIAVNTPLSPEIRPIIAGILFALMKSANVICLPRSVYDARSRALGWGKCPTYGHETRIDADHCLLADQAVLEELLGAVAAKMPVVVASGNAGLDTLEYPASLVSEKAKDLIVVGAVNGKRKRSSYTSGVCGELTVLAPSDDAERWDERLRRVDPDGRRSHDHELVPPAPPQATRDAQEGCIDPTIDPSAGDFSEWRVLAVQAPRAWPWRTGKAARIARESLDDSARTALYMPFGGTSAACAIVAGIASLMQRQVWKSEEGGRCTQLSGVRAKKALVAGMPHRVDGVPIVDAEIAVANLGRRATDVDGTPPAGP